MAGRWCVPHLPQRPDHSLMLLLTLLTLVVMALGVVLLAPLLNLVTPVLSLAWLGWALLLLGLWVFAAPSPEDPPSHP